uniref:Uncharacterized protein n=1 Tax=Inkyuleea mariana TaxID=123988 RepID=A0A4D6WZZ2_9FLOR|nr:hypothetical protein [Inkyuleea mariana]
MLEKFYHTNYLFTIFINTLISLLKFIRKNYHYYK